MNDNLNAFSTDDPETVAAYREAVELYNNFGKRLFADIQALGADDELVPVRQGVLGSPNRIVALNQKGDVVPEGWRKVRGRLEPRRGNPGQPARDWLANHQPPDVRHTMTEYGLPRSSWVERPGSFGWRVVSPELFEHDGTLWACYEGTPGHRDSDFDDSECTWTPRKLSEFYVAKEAFEADQKAKV